MTHTRPSADFFLLTLLVVAVAVSSWKGYSAIRITPSPETAKHMLIEDVPQPLPAQPTPESVLVTILEKNPLHPQRKRMPRSAPSQATAPTSDVPRMRLDELQLVGTTALGNGKGFALIAQRGHQTPRLVRVGELIGETFRLKSVESGGAVLTANDSTFRLKISRTW